MPGRFAPPGAGHSPPHLTSSGGAVNIARIDIKDSKL